jgi:predicted phosphodiesterase
VFLSDIHAPFEDQAAMATVLRIMNDYQPDLTIIGGDAVDFYGISTHDKDPDRRHTLQEEFDAAFERVFAPIDQISERVLYIPGNHEARMFRMIRDKPALFNLRSLSLKTAMGLPARWDVYANQTHLRIGKLLYLHGDLNGRGGGAKNIASNMLDKMRTNCLFGHFHRVQHVIRTDYEGRFTGAWANGHLCDVSQARYVSNPDWQQSITLVEYTRDMEKFQVYQVLIHNGEAVWLN